jgi:HemY protein
MKRLIFYCFILIIAVGLGLLIAKDPGYVLLSYRHWTVETSLWFFMVSVLACVFALHYGLGLMDTFQTWMMRFRFWRERVFWQKAHALTARGMLALAEGKWGLAEKFLARAATRGDLALPNYLCAAQAAAKQGALPQRDAYLQKAFDISASGELAVGLTQAQLQVDDAEWELALASLQRLRALVPRHAYVLKLLKRVYYELNDWESLLTLLPELQRQRLLVNSEYDVLMRRAYECLLQQSQDLDKQHAIWGMMSRQCQREPKLAMLYYRGLLAHHQTREVLERVKADLDRVWDDDLCVLFMEVEASDLLWQQKALQHWLKRYGRNAVLLNGLGKLAFRLKSFRIAENYWTDSLSLQKTREAFLGLASLYEQEGELEKAVAMFKKAERA